MLILISQVAPANAPNHDNAPTPAPNPAPSTAPAPPAPTASPTVAATTLLSPDPSDELQDYRLNPGGDLQSEVNAK